MNLQASESLNLVFFLLDRWMIYEEKDFMCKVYRKLVYLSIKLGIIDFLI